MTLEEIQAAYPTIPLAVDFGETFLDRIRRAASLGADPVEYVVSSVEFAKANLPEVRVVNRAKFDKLLAEFRSPEFRTYLAGRLGLV